MIEQEIAEIESDLKILRKQQSKKTMNDSILLPDKTRIYPWYVLDEQIRELEDRLVVLKRQRKNDAHSAP